MSGGILLDTHVLLWLENRRPFDLRLLQRFDQAILSASLFASHISMWELGVALTKRQQDRRPELAGLTPGVWFEAACKRNRILPLQIDAEVAAEAALVPQVYQSGDPGDCFLIAAARIHRLSLATRDEQILTLAERDPEYLSAIPC